MPEGPEVKRITDWLNRKFKDKNLISVLIKKGRYIKHGPPRGYTNFTSLLPLKIKSINCHGKFIWWEFHNSNITLWNTLGMTGWWTTDVQKHNNLEFKIGNNKLYFNDVRNFGTFIFCTNEQLKKKLNILGPDILQIKDNSKIFLERLERKRSDTYIASAILDQKVAAGCGNYIRAEALYLSRINPFLEINKISKKRLLLLWNMMRQIAWYFYNPSKGKKLKILNNLINKYEKIYKSIKKPETYIFLVYGEDEDPYGNKVITKKIKDRTIHYVPKIQK